VLQGSWTVFAATAVGVAFVTVAQAQTTGPIPVTGEQNGAIRCGVGGAKGRGRGEYEPTKHAPDSAPGIAIHGRNDARNPLVDCGR
jgi:hypothetical protein